MMMQLVVCIILISLPSCVGFYTFPRLLLRRDVRSTPPLPKLEFRIPSSIFSASVSATLPSKEYTERVDVNSVVINLLTLYKQFAGDLWISPLYTIRRKKYASWPEWSYGIKLGRMVSTIRQLYKEDALSKDSINALEQIGFPWKRKLPYGDKVILEALLTYQVLYGDMLVPRNFIIPDNDTCWSQSLGRMKLGCVVSSIRNGAVHLNMKPCLVNIGFDYTRQNETSEKGGLECLHNPAKELKLHEVFNSDTCPEHIRWIKVHLSEGNTLQEAMNQTAGRLYNTIPEKCKISHSYLEVKGALLSYKAKHGDMLVPIKYLAISSDPDNPEQYRELKLGHQVQQIRNQEKFAEHREDLEMIGFDYQKQIGNFSLVNESLLAYKAIYGDLRVPQDYKIAKDDERYPEKVRGTLLGNIVQCIRTQGSYVRHRPELLRMGFDFDMEENVFHIFLKVKEALLTYKVLHGDLKVPAAYIIAADDTRYPERVRGMKLGNVVNSIRNQGAYADHREELGAMGFLYDQQIRVSTFAEVKEALLNYKELYGDLKVPQSYFIAEDDTRYPERVRGMKLGIVARSIRNQGYYADHREELGAMGFLFDRQMSTFAEVKEALLTYKVLHGDLKVPAAYIIAADDTRYPERVRGMKLGNVVNKIRNQGYYEDHREELEAMGFLFDRQMSTFAEVKEALLTYTALYGDLKVPAAYIIAADDIQYPERVRGMKLGNVVISIRNQGYYEDHREELEAMGFLFDRQKRISTFAEVKEALLTYKALYGDLKVPQSYIIAEDFIRYPERLRGMKLGIVVNSIRNQGTHADHREELEAMGFIFQRRK